MEKKRPGRPPSEEKPGRLTVNLPEAIIEKLKEQAINKGVSISSIVAKLLKEKMK